jgi:hypothetical protein
MKNYIKNQVKRILPQRPLALELKDASELFIGNYVQPETVFFILGHPKSGTTWACLMMNSHPEISCNYEGHFFERNDGFLTLSNALTGNRALRLWQQRSFNKWVNSSEKDLDIYVKLITQYYFQRICVEKSVKIGSLCLHIGARKQKDI